MLTQSIPDGGSASNGASAPSSPSGTGDSFVDSALEAFEALSEPSGRRTRPAEPREQPQEPEGDEDDGQDVEGLESQPDNDNAEPEETEEDEGHDTRGSEDDPFTVKDLPADKFIELKVDGEKIKVSLSEMAAGYIREKTFSARINKTKQLADEAQQAVHAAKQMQARVASEFREFVGDPDQLFEFFTKTEAREQVFEQAAMRYAGLLKRFRENPHERLAYERQRDVERLNAEREHFESQKRAEHEQRVRKEQTEAALRVFKPGWEAGLRRAGFPQATQALWDEVMVRCDQRVKSGARVTSDDVTEFVVRAAKLLELPPASKTRPRSAPSKAPPPRARQKDRWSEMSPAERRRDPEYFLRNLKPRDFR